MKPIAKHAGYTLPYQHRWAFTVAHWLPVTATPCPRE